MRHLIPGIISMLVLCEVSAHTAAQTPFTPLVGQYDVGQGECVDERDGNRPVEIPAGIHIASDRVTMRYAQASDVTIHMREEHDVDDGFSVSSGFDNRDGVASYSSLALSGFNSVSSLLKIWRGSDDHLMFEHWLRADVIVSPRWIHCRLLLNPTH